MVRRQEARIVGHAVLGNPDSRVVVREGGRLHADENVGRALANVIDVICRQIRLEIGNRRPPELNPDSVRVITAQGAAACSPAAAANSSSHTARRYSPPR